MLNIEKLSKCLPANVVSFRFQLPENATVQNSKSTLNQLESLSESMRSAVGWGTEYIILDLTKTVAINDRLSTVINKTIYAIGVKNVIGLVLWVSHKPDKRLKPEIKKIKDFLKVKKYNSVRLIVKKPQKLIEGLGKIILSVAGLALVGGAQLFEMELFKLWGNEFKSNIPQLSALLFTAAPWLLAPLIDRFLTRDKKEKE